MATRNQGLFVWHDLITTDVPAAVAFYGEVVGWRTEPFGQDGYTMWASSQGPMGGVMAIDAEGARTGMRPHWMAHVHVDDVDDRARAAAALGGRVCRAPSDIPTVGRFAVVADPAGATLSLFQPLPGQEIHPRDLSRDGEFRWNELHAPDGAAAARFHGELLGWKILEEMDMGPMGKYRVFGLGDRQLGGIMPLQPGAPLAPSWLPYVATSDLDAAVARARRRSATLLNGPMDVPGGRVAQLRDPQGAPFALHEAAQ
jgi:predicted enzyme related to lactoylglutathione lyase